MTNGKKDILGVAVTVLLFFAMLVAGCEDDASNQAITVTRTPAPLSASYSVPVQLPDGKMTTISKIGSPFYVVAFVKVPSDNPCYLSPEVERISQKLWLDSINVIQVSIPTSSTMFPDNVMTVCTPPKNNLVRIFDQDRRAWNWFNQPRPGTLLLIDQYGTVSSAGTLTNPDDVLFDTERLSDNWNQRWNPTLNLEAH